MADSFAFLLLTSELRLELSLFHLVREREEVLDKLERVHQRRVESVS